MYFVPFFIFYSKFNIVIVGASYLEIVRPAHPSILRFSVDDDKLVSV